MERKTGESVRTCDVRKTQVAAAGSGDESRPQAPESQLPSKVSQKDHSPTDAWVLGQ